jgi:hypothetical protein
MMINSPVNFHSSIIPLYTYKKYNYTDLTRTAFTSHKYTSHKYTSHKYTAGETALVLSIQHAGKRFIIK